MSRLKITETFVSIQGEADAVGQQFVGQGGLGHRQDAVDDRAHHACMHPRPDVALDLQGRDYRGRTSWGTCFVDTRSGDTVVTDGPFLETKEMVGGLVVVDVDDLDAALGWATRLADAIGQPIEVRPFAG